MIVVTGCIFGLMLSKKYAQSRFKDVAKLGKQFCCQRMLDMERILTNQIRPSLFVLAYTMISKNTSYNELPLFTYYSLFVICYYLFVANGQQSSFILSITIV